MKKLLAFALTFTMILSLAACGGKDDPKPSGNDTSGTSQQASESTPADPAESEAPADPPPGGSPMEDLLARAGLTLADIEPDEPYYRVGLDDDENIIFYMEKETERNTAVYLNKLVEATRAAADDGKLYEADFNFYMGSNLTEFPPLPPDEEINGYANYLAQYGYMKNGATVSVTFGNIADFDPERGDDVYYPTYSVGFTF